MSDGNLTLREMMEKLKADSKAFNERFNTLKIKYDELSDKRCQILECVEQKTKELKAQTQQYETAMKEYNKAENKRAEAEFDIYLALNMPNHMIYSPECHQQHKEQSYLSRICAELDRNHYTIVDNFLSDIIAQEIYKEVKLMHINGELKLGKTGGGKSVNNAMIDGKRFDLITYIKVDKKCKQSKLNDFVDTLDQMVHNVCHNMNELKLKMVNRGNLMVSCYEKNAYYISHVDNPNDNGRILTALLYINPSWKKQDGGQLLIHRCGAKTHSETLQYNSTIHNEKCIMIEPKWNRLVLFWSDKRNLHQVETSHRNRYAISIWYQNVRESLKAKR